MVSELRDHDVGQQPCGRDAFVDDLSRNWCLDQGFALITDPLATDVPLDGEHARRVIELLADILADALELTSTSADGRPRLVLDIYTWKVRRKRCPARFVRRVFGLWLGGQPLQLEFDGGQVASIASSSRLCCS